MYGLKTRLINRCNGVFSESIIRLPNWGKVPTRNTRKKNFIKVKQTRNSSLLQNITLLRPWTSIVDIDADVTDFKDLIRVQCIIFPWHNQSRCAAQVYRSLKEGGQWNESAGVGERHNNVRSPCSVLSQLARP
ncbi:hypothetical protein RRG08_003477 [Elysia crispata]|uniref:Uncharacterized protein n=1 Tax=Elysia crispata TaxID=231223 RepID=A0AAE0Y6T9_9GAST|nr:hypothetical protein RRG08_003477 [Elysia crispata]